MKDQAGTAVMLTLESESLGSGEALRGAGPRRYGWCSSEKAGSLVTGLARRRSVQAIGVPYLENRRAPANNARLLRRLTGTCKNLSKT
jgi:hypothetical protein